MRYVITMAIWRKNDMDFRLFKGELSFFLLLRPSYVISGLT